MSDLQCPATLLVCRHGEAERALPGDTTRDGDRLSELGRDQARQLAWGLRGRRVAGIYTSTNQCAAETAQFVAEALGVRVEPVEGLAVNGLDVEGAADDRADELTAAGRGEEDGHRVVARLRETLEGIADLHRGETVLVVSDGRALALVLPRQAVARGDLMPHGLPPACVPTQVEIDADGWRLAAWPAAGGPTQG